MKNLSLPEGYSPVTNDLNSVCCIILHFPDIDQDQVGIGISFLLPLKILSGILKIDFLWICCWVLIFGRHCKFSREFIVCRNSNNLCYRTFGDLKRLSKIFNFLNPADSMCLIMIISHTKTFVSCTYTNIS